MKTPHHTHQLRIMESPLSPSVAPFAGTRRFARALRTGTTTFFFCALALVVSFASPLQTQAAKVAAGVYHSLYVTDGGKLYAMGGNNYGQLGGGSNDNYDPVLIASNIVSVATRGYHSFYITTEGELYGMGRNSFGQLGDKTYTDRATPVFIADNVTSVAAGYDHSLYITTDGNLYGMGENYCGQLGDNTPDRKATPILIASNVASVTAGYNHSLYVTTDGELYAMGGNAYGQLGDGTYIDKTTPVLVAKNVTTVTASNNHSLYITTDGELYAMGMNTFGELGDNTYTSHATPVFIASDVALVAAGWGRSLYVTTAGKLYGVGSGGHINGQQYTFIADNIASVAMGYSHSLYITTNGNLYTMGWNNYGQLGDGTNTDKNTPVFITNISAPPNITTQPQAQTVNVGDTVTFSVTATGTTPLSYQWYFNNTTLAGETSATLTLASVTVANTGEYTVKINNVAGEITSDAAKLKLTVNIVPPVIVMQPQAQAVNAGGSVAFTVATTGTPPLIYQWYFNNIMLAGETSTALILDNVTVANAGEYAVKISNAAGEITSAAAKLTVHIVPPTIATQPQSQTANAGGTATFTVAATGTPPLIYQWYFNNIMLAGETSTALILDNITVANAGEYTVKINNAAGEITSAAAKLTVNITPPTIATQPQSQAVNAGGTVTFTVAATGTAPLNYQWYFNNTTLTGETFATLALANVTLTNAGEYTVKINNAAGEVTSAAAVLTVNTQPPLPSQPDIATPPRSQTVSVGGTATFTVIAIGEAPLGYQWYFNNIEIAGETADTLTLANVSAANAGEYTVRISNAAGVITSDTATLTVNIPDTAPSIATQPLSQTIDEGEAVTFTVAATGTAPLSYQWYFNPNSAIGNWFEKKVLPKDFIVNVLVDETKQRRLEQNFHA